MATREERAQKRLEEHQLNVDRYNRLERILWPKIVLCLANGTDHELPPEHDFTWTSRHLREKYGRPALELVELLFIRWMRGGVYSLAGELIKPCWKLNPLLAVAFAQWADKTDERTCQAAVKHLKSLGAEHLQGLRRFQDGKVLPRQLASRAEKRVLLAENKAERERYQKEVFERAQADAEEINAKRH